MFNEALCFYSSANSRKIHTFIQNVPFRFISQYTWLSVYLSGMFQMRFWHAYTLFVYYIWNLTFYDLNIQNSNSAQFCEKFTFVSWTHVSSKVSSAAQFKTVGSKKYKKKCAGISLVKDLYSHKKCIHIKRITYFWSDPDPHYSNGSGLAS